MHSVMHRMGRVLVGLDPRAGALRFPRLTVFLFVLVTAVFVWGNARTEKGGILDHAILNPDDPALVADHEVETRVQEGFRATEFVPYIFRFGHACTRQDLLRVTAFTERLQLEFGDRVLSGATAPNFRDDGTTVDDTPYLTREILNAPSFSMDAWQETVRRDTHVYGVLVGRQFEWASVLLFLEPGYDQTTSFRHIVSFLEERDIPSIEWWWKRSIHPTDPTIGVGGWVMGRGMIDQTLNVDVLTLVTVGLILVFLVFWNAFRSLTLALVSTFIIIGTSIVWVRGSIGLLDLCGWPIRERVYVLLAYSNCIVQGVSFALHRFEGLYARPGTRTDQLRASQAVDGLIGVTAANAIFGFATLWCFTVLSIRELGVLSALGVVYIVALAWTVSPAVILLAARGTARRDAGSPSAVHRYAASLMGAFIRQLMRWSARTRVCVALLVILVPLLAAGMVVTCGGIVAKSRALEYIQGTLVEETATFMNVAGRPGFDYLDLLIEPADMQVPVEDPQFLRAVVAYRGRILQDAGAREAFSIVGSVERVSEELFHHALPVTEDEAREAFFYVENAFGPALHEQWWYDHGVRLSVSMEMDDSVALGAFIARVQTLARAYPTLVVRPFGKVPMYPQVDGYIRTGKPLNVLSSQVVIIGLAFLWLLWRGRGRRVRIRPLVGAVAMSLPFVFAGSILVLWMGWMSIPLDIAVAAITALAINAAIDFSLYLIAAYDAVLAETGDANTAWARAMEAEGTMLLLDAGMNALCFSPLLLSHFEPARRLGGLMILILAACAVGSLFVMMSVVSYCVQAREEQ